MDASNVASENQHQSTPPSSLTQEFNPSLLRTPLVQARAPDHRVPSQIRRAHRKPPNRTEPSNSSATLPVSPNAESNNSRDKSAANSINSQCGFDAAEFDLTQSSGSSSRFSSSQLNPADLSLVPPLMDSRRSGSSSDWRWSLSTQYRSSQILELGQATPMDINLDLEPREVRIERLRGSASSSASRPVSTNNHHPLTRARSSSQAVSDSSLPYLPLNPTTSTLVANNSHQNLTPPTESSAPKLPGAPHRKLSTNSASSPPSLNNEYVTATELTSSDSDEARRRARSSVSPQIDPNRALPLLPTQPARYRRTTNKVDATANSLPTTGNLEDTVKADFDVTSEPQTHRHRSTIKSISKLEDLLNEANNMSFRSSSDLPTSADSPQKTFLPDPTIPQHIHHCRSFTATPPHLMSPQNGADMQSHRISANDSLNLLNPSPRPLLAPIDPTSNRHRRQRHVSSPVEGSSDPISSSDLPRPRNFTQHSLEDLMAQNPSPYDLKDIGLPTTERRLLEKFVDSLSNLSVEVQMDEKKRKEGRRRLNNALRALEGWI